MTAEQKEKAKEIINQHETNIKSIDTVRSQLCDLFLYKLLSIGLSAPEVDEIFLEVTMKNIQENMPKDKEFRHKVFDILDNI